MREQRGAVSIGSRQEAGELGARPGRRRRRSVMILAGNPSKESGTRASDAARRGRRARLSMELGLASLHGAGKASTRRPGRVSE
jgi:hypothetical protein